MKLRRVEQFAAAVGQRPAFRQGHDGIVHQFGAGPTVEAHGQFLLARVAGLDQVGVLADGLRGVAFDYLGRGLHGHAEAIVLRVILQTVRLHFVQPIRRGLGVELGQALQQFRDFGDLGKPIADIPAVLLVVLALGVRVAFALAQHEWCSLGLLDRHRRGFIGAEAGERGIAHIVRLGEEIGNGVGLHLEHKRVVLELGVVVVFLFFDHLRGHGERALRIRRCRFLLGDGAGDSTDTQGAWRTTHDDGQHPFRLVQFRDSLG